MHEKNNTILTLGSLIEWGKASSEMPLDIRKKRAGAVWNDSRKVGPGDVFVAIETGQDDGHKYVESAFKAGAVAAIVKKTKIKDLPAGLCRHLIAVTDPLKAVQRMGTCYREKMGILFIGITGSSGKTTTRTFISSVLRQGLNISETFGNWNNHIGVPLSILKFRGDEWAGVIEMGANHMNEIHTLSKIVKPDIAVITNIGYAHVGLFGSIENTAKAKFEIADGLNGSSAFMLLNGDDPRCVKGARERGLRAIYYGTGKNAGIRAENISIHPLKGVTFEVDGCTYKISMPGRHFVYCALPAIFMGRRCGISEKEIALALASQKPVSMRGTVERKHGINFIVDCYNANPSSMQSGITYLTDLAPASKRVAVVGDMLELGSYSKRLHRELGRQLAGAHVKKVIAVGSFASEIAEGAKKAGVHTSMIFTTERAEDAVSIVREEVRKNDTVLLKGSRGVHLEVVFENL